MKRWEPTAELTKQEELLLRHVVRTRKLFSFLRRHRHELFDVEFQGELETMYRGSGKAPLPPALLAMATLLQGYLGVSDAEAVQLSVVDLRWQMVLGCLGGTAPAFSQGALHDFRARLIRTNMDRRLLERTVELARRTGAFDWKKLPKSLDVAIDSSPLEGCGRVEDTANLLAHAARNLAECAAGILGWKSDEVAQAAGIPLLLESSPKKALDIDWADEAAKRQAIERVATQAESLRNWVETNLKVDGAATDLKCHVATLDQIRDQDLVAATPGGPKLQLRDGVAEDRRISIEDAEMRHGRKSKSRRIDGFKRHIASDTSSQLIYACAVTPANLPEAAAGATLKIDIDRQGLSIDGLHIDRAYMRSSVVDDVLTNGGAVFCKPWVARNGKLFSKGDFDIDLERMKITCPAGATQDIERGTTVQFDAATCDTCEQRSRCTTASDGRGRGVRIAPDEDFQQYLRGRMASSAGRAKLRERVTVEHRLSHIGARQGPRARYRGVRSNVYDLRRAATIQNLETVHRWERQLPQAA